MPPKVKITKTDIVETALSLVRESGAEALNARDLASALNCSTQPIFSNFSNMEELRDEIINAAYSLYLEFIKKETESQKYPPYKASGMAYIRFAKDEKELFKLLFMRDRTKEELSTSPDFENAVELIMKANGVTREKATLMHLEVWACVHGIGTMLATSFLPLEWETISNMLTDIYMGIRARHLSEEQ
jgi:AcrR family transcriptional regulator